MRVLLIFLMANLLSLLSVHSQINEFPYYQGFENRFLAFGPDAIFIEGWSGNQVQKTSSRIFQAEKLSRGGKHALAVQPISSFDGVLILDLHFNEPGDFRIHFYARTQKNGTGSRPVLVRISTSIDGGQSFINRENIGDETTFPNMDTDYALYIYDLPPDAVREENMKVKLEILYTSVFGEGTAARFLMDDFSIHKKESDVKVAEVLHPESEILQIVFNQEVDRESAENHHNYLLQPQNVIISAKRDERSKNTINLQLSKELKTGDNLLLIKGVYNIEKERAILAQEHSFIYNPPPVIPGFNELIITEIMADPDPPIGLPLSEYIEIFNPTDKTLILKDVIFSDANSNAKLTDAVILPGKYLLLVPVTKIDLFAGISPVLGVTSWPSLNVGGDLLTLLAPDGSLIFSIEYDKSWYGNPLKGEGGWSLEMIDVNNPCVGKENWSASLHRDGGSPTMPNAVQADKPDIILPKLIEAMAISKNKVLLQFDEKIRPELIDPSYYSIIPSIEITSSEIQKPLISSIILTLDEDIKPNTTYEVTVQQLKDCTGNDIDEKHSSKQFGLPETADSLNVIINEVLFNSQTGGVKFVEIYNNSSKYINLKNWYLGNDLDTHNSSLKILSKEDFILDPGSYLAISQNNEKLKSEYPRGKEEKFKEIPALPSYTISEGTVVLYNERSEIIDYFAYSDAFHSPLLKSTKGVSLERISFTGDSNHPSNWHSAASTVGFATPGYQNSQIRSIAGAAERLTVEPKVFVPENTGASDFTSIQYKLGTGGFYGTLHILDTKGNLVKKIAKNEQLPSEGFFTWDGTDDNNNKVRIGYYLVYFEIYNLSGFSETLKETVVVGKRF